MGRGEGEPFRAMGRNVGDVEPEKLARLQNWMQKISLHLTRAVICLIMEYQSVANSHYFLTHGATHYKSVYELSEKYGTAEKGG